MVNRSAIVADARHAAGGALATLDRIRASPHARGCSDVGASNSVHKRAAVPGVRVGVAKLGHAWEAKHVRVFAGVAELATALCELTDGVGCEARSVLVQDYVPNDFELRAYVVRGVICHTVYSTFGGFSDEGYALDFALKTRSQAISDWLQGDEGAMARAERRVSKLVSRWLEWLGCAAATAGVLPCIRMDFLVRRSAPGRAQVHTLELTELGFSLLGWLDGPREVLGALLESCFDDTGPTASEAQLLLAHRERLAAMPMKGSHLTTGLGHQDKRHKSNHPA